MKMKETSLFDSLLEEPQKPSGPVTCLGMTFENDEARRAHFTEELRKKLQDPEFRKIEGFPIGSDEDILNLSDPPYYTACPNPWIADFIAEWEAQKPEQPEGYHYHREPFAADVSEGKNDPIYNAHSYHTKVPHKAIMRYILHYTQPGDIVFDGFCGTGMTGVAAQMCGDREVVMSLGYQVKPDGTILQEETDEDGKKVWRPFSKLGVRRAVLNELSPFATFVANSLNIPPDFNSFENQANKLFQKMKDEYGWMYETSHKNGRKGVINYVIWSDLYICSSCSNEISFWQAAVNMEESLVTNEFNCPTCGTFLKKRDLERVWVSRAHPITGIIHREAKQYPVRINYSVGKERHDKSPDSEDLLLIKKISEIKHEFKIPTDEIVEGDKTGDPLGVGINRVYQYYTDRNLVVLSAMWSMSSSELKPIITSFLENHASKRNRYLLDRNHTMGTTGGPFTGTLYLPPLSCEVNVLNIFKKTLNKYLNSYRSRIRTDSTVISTASTTSDLISENTIDYIFLDPPFGANYMYSELNFSWESWLCVKTNNSTEAIQNKSQGKELSDYRTLMVNSLKQCYRFLKPGHWITVEFSNTRASVWNSIQTSMSEAGFIVANVSALDKKHGGLKSMTYATAVKQDLVISAYKPNGGFEVRFEKEAKSEEGVWDFVRTHLKYLPVTKRQGQLMLFVPERDPRILFDQMIAFYVRKGYPVPISSQGFQVGLSQRFIERDGMYFLPDQVAEYDRKKMTSGAPQQLSMFVSDEASAIQWLRQLIKEKPQTFSDINPQFMQQLGGWSKNEAQLDLRELLNQNFLCYDGKGPVPEQIHAYLSSNWKELRNLPKDDPALVSKARDRWYVPDPNKAGDLEKLREKALLKEFEEYKEVKKKLKVFRLEAVRAGFKKAWQERDYAVIVALADKIPNNVLEEDPKLLMWYDQAVTRMGGE
jgi:DNA modification methylase/DNA-directed RNA polymerase subunit RPC12/RpoP